MNPMCFMIARGFADYFLLIGMVPQICSYDFMTFVMFHVALDDNTVLCKRPALDDYTLRARLGRGVATLPALL